MLCEMCGAESASLESRKVSGSVLRVCTSCAGMGKQTSHRESVSQRAFVAQTLEKRVQKTRYKEISSDEKVLVRNFGDIVRKAREKKGLDHQPIFEIELRVKDFDVILGHGKSLQIAQKQTAEKFIKK